ncbi:MAG: GGDEF domain-containing protein [Sphingopyxis sp.]|uniref:GGDEF domain-containing protein n=1 Tax=Sphingopyxis sp. TaxID=1908224 RepID=UPI002AB7F79F|nr:GGDEF domain-containing protein [Sphingopyxis sp.]MDZ3832927.1 GGDEF domain-containing protein [Sphingopyxis sp.]
MTAAFVLGINMFVVGVFAVAFGVVAATNRGARGARWMAFGYASGILAVGLEYVLPWQSDPTPVGVSIYLAYLLAMTLCVVGIARHYRADPPWLVVLTIWGGSIMMVPLIFSLAYGSPLRLALYQFSYFVMQALALMLVWRSGQRQRLDMLLMCLMALAALIYIAKPLIAWKVGTAATPQGYMETIYAAISQSLGAGTLVALALVLLLIMMRDTTAEIIARSETDALSGVLNRRGFGAHAERALDKAREAGRSAVLVAADLDHFKAINDSFGHAAGDGVIVRFAAMLRAAAPAGAIVSRPGGEEFAVLLTGATLADGRLYAEGVRRDFASCSLIDAGVDSPVSASFGVAQMMPGDGLSSLWRRADDALYRAKAGGRNRVSLALAELPSGTRRAAGTAL